VLNPADLRLLRVFATVVECGGFAAAQVELNVGQSTISTQMADLEARLGMRLCRRGRAGFGLTDDGHAVHEATQRLFRAINAFGSEVGAIGGRLVGDLHIAVLDNMISNPAYRMDEALARFKRREGAVHMVIHVASPIDIERAVLDGRYHVGVGTFPNHAPGLAYARLFDEAMALYCGRGHPLFAAGTVSMEAVENADYVHRGYATAGRAGGRLPANATATAYNMEAVAVMVLSGRFIGHLPTHYAARWVDAGAMRPLLPGRYGFVSRFETVVRRGIPRTAAIDAFLADLAAVHDEGVSDGMDALASPGA